MEIFTTADADFGENSYLIRGSGKFFIIDPGFNSNELKKMLDGAGGKLSAIFLTHGHYDHIFSLSEFPAATVYAHIDEKELLEDPQLNLSAFTGKAISAKNFSFYRGAINSIENFRIYHTPGHTRGSVVMSAGKNIFSGDTLFEDSVGRTDTPCGDSLKLKESLKIFKSFETDSIIYPGHGKPFLLNDAMNNNYFLRNIK
jgi:glyoxylase-like metal-dependent hydrolase (beta-lactamase superfamily II)